MTSLTTASEPVVRVSDPVIRRRVIDRGTVPAERAATVGSTGLPAIEPLVTVTQAGATAFYTQCAPHGTAILDAIDDAIDGAAADGPTREPDAVVDHDPTTTRLPVAHLPGLDTGVRTVLGACGWRRPTTPTDHEAAGGFEPPDPAAVLELGASLRGRGWGDLCHDAPLGETWETVRKADDSPTVVVNAHGNTADTLLLESAPFE